MNEIRILERGLEQAERFCAPFETGRRLVEALIEARQRKIIQETLIREDTQIAGEKNGVAEAAGPDLFEYSKIQ